MNKKKWERPKLIVLVRDKLENEVLYFCKGGGRGSPYSAEVGCTSIFNIECESCNDYTES